MNKTHSEIKKTSKTLSSKIGLIIFLTICSIIALGMSGLYLANDDETKELTQAIRDEMGVLSVSTNGYKTAYEIANPNASETVVLVHGFSVPSYLWEPTFQFFKSKGKRVLRFDLVGRGMSDRPDVQYDIDTYVEQLFSLLNELKINEPFHLVGLSMGGPITTRFTHLYSSRVSSLSLLAPLVQTPDSLQLSLIKTPLVGEYLATTVMMPGIKNGLHRSVFDPSVFPDYVERMEQHMIYKGYRRALLKTARYLGGKSFVEDYKKLGESGLPVQLIWGENDKVVPVEQSDLIVNSLDNASVHRLENCGHLPQIEYPERVSKLLLQFMEQH